MGSTRTALLILLDSSISGLKEEWEKYVRVSTLRESARSGISFGVIGKASLNVTIVTLFLEN